MKNVSAEQLMDIVYSVHGGAVYAEPTIASQLLLGQHERKNGAADVTKSLTPREYEILTLVTKSLTNKEIARSYNIAEKTVKHYMTSIMQKLQARNRVEAALIAQKQIASQPPN
jgi:DNA-binding NarL/FixJ family response regulator